MDQDLNKLLSSLSPADVAALLRADSSTLRAHVWTWLATTKTGGCHTAGGIADHFDDGVRLVEFAPLIDPALVPQTISRAVGLTNRQDTEHMSALCASIWSTGRS